jgi:hypothetical protein
MKWFETGRAIISAAAALLLVVLAMWIWTRADSLAAAMASSFSFESPVVSSAVPSLRLVEAIQALAIAAAAAGQALLLRDVVPMFYARRWLDELLQMSASLIVVGGLLAGIVLLVESGG